MIDLIDFEEARAVLLDGYNAILRGSHPFGDVVFPGHAASYLMHVTDLVWTKYIFGDMDLTDAERDSWASRINRDQAPATGMFRYPPGERHIDAHATWQCVAALNMLERRPRHRLSVLEPVATPDGFRAWCDDYDSSTSHHRFMLAVLAAASMPVSAEWRAVFGRWYDARQDPETGFPCEANSAHSLSPAFLLTTMRSRLSGPVPRAARIVRTVLAFQNASGGFPVGSTKSSGRRGTDSALPGYMEMDACFLLHLLAPGAGRERETVETALGRAGALVSKVLRDAESRERLLASPHRALAVCGNLSVLWRHFDLCGGRSVPFPWAELELYRAPV